MALSSWLTEDITLNNLIPPRLSSSQSKQSPVAISSYYEDYTNYGNKYGDESFYYKDNYHAYYDYDKYSKYSKYGQYTKYAEYSQYSKNSYYDYTNSCVRNCQICNTCQSKCEINQFVSHYIGNFNYSDDLVYIEASNLNDLVNYINQAAKEALLTIDLTDNKVVVTDIVNHTSFSVVNDAINQFIDGTTNLENKVGGETALKKEMQQLKLILDQIKIPDTIPCCQNINYQTCITRQK